MPRFAKARIEKLDRILQAVERCSEELARAVQDDLRKPEPEIRLSEIYPVVTEIKRARRHLSDWVKPVAVPSPLVLLGARSEMVADTKRLLDASPCLARLGHRNLFDSIAILVH